MALKRQTLLYAFRGEGAAREVLLGKKERGFGAGMIMGLGGHVEPGESNAEAAVREAEEEAGISVSVDMITRRATLTYRFPAEPSWDAEVAVYVARDWSGEVVASEELEPAWFPVDRLPLEQMWDDERHWLPSVLGGIDLVAEFVFDEVGARVARHSIVCGSALPTDDWPSRGGPAPAG